MLRIRDLFNKYKKSSSEAFKDLNAMKNVNYSPMSDRYTYENQEDTEYDKDWKPESKLEKETLSPEGYYRQGERKAQKQSLLQGIVEAEQRKLQSNPSVKLSKLDIETAKNKANEIFDDQYREKQISIPSTAIDKINYDPKSESLRVKFQDGKKNYFYPNVPNELIRAWMKAPSKGEFFMKNIHDQYTMNPGHRPAGQSRSYGNMSKSQVEKFFNKYGKAYDKSNENKMAKIRSKYQKKGLEI